MDVTMDLTDIPSIFEDKARIYTINDVAEVAHIHPQTLRNWERAGLLSPQRISGQQRVYARRDLERIELICMLKDKGLNVNAIVFILSNIHEEK